MIGNDSTLCFHCGAPLPAGANWQTTVLGASRRMCCAGCAAVASSIVDAGLQQFYRERNGYSNTIPDQLPDAEHLRLFDARSTTGEAAPDQLMTDSYAVDGIRCAACIWLIERTVRGMPGVSDADLNLGTGTLQLRRDPARCQPSDVLRTIQSIGYRAHPADTTPYSERLRKEQRRLFRRLFIAGLSMMQVMMYAVPAYLATDGTMDSDMAGLMRWAGFLLTVPAVLYSAQPFFAGAWQNLRQRVLGMDVPVVLGIGTAFVASTVATLAGRDPVYFDSITMFIFLLLGSRYLELQARLRAASALDGLLRATPASARRLPDWPQDQRSELVVAEALRPGDRILLNPGDVLAADGVIERGATSIDLSVLSGESRALARQTGDALPAGATNLTHSVVLRIERAAGTSTLSLIVEAARKARLAKPALATWADMVAARFVAVLLLMALVTFLVWESIDPARGWEILIAMLVVSCPCALSLAAPTVLAAANARLLGSGILATQPWVLETLHRATHIVLDKTGTLTSGRPVLREIDTFGSTDRDAALSLAAGIAAHSNHPLSAAIQTAAAGLPGRPGIHNSQNVPGRGIEAELDGYCCRLGNASFVAELAGSPAPFVAQLQHSEVFLGSSAGWIARFTVHDALRTEARGVVDYFKTRGKEVLLLSGDQQRIVQGVAQELGITGATGDCLPDEKERLIRALQQQGAVVAMVGDGINDAAVLAAADVSFAMGEGSSLAQASADCVLLSGRLDSLCEIDRIAGQSARLMKQNLAWAACYNLLAIPAAAFGLIDPWVSAVGMSLSSIVVVLNALRIYGRKQRKLHAAQSFTTSVTA